MVSPLAYVHPDAIIGSNVVIEPFATVAGDVEIGEGTWIASGAHILDGARIGRKCKIFQGAVISEIPQDLKYTGEQTYVSIGDNTMVRECVTVNRGTSAKGTTSVGNNCLLMAYTHVAHDCTVGDNCIMVNYSGIAGEVVLGEWTILGGGTVVHQFVEIGEHVITRGGSLVGKDIPPYVIAGREPLAYCGINAVGLRRRGFTNDKVNELQDIYRALFNQGMNYSVAVQYIEENYPVTPERDRIIDFVRNSRRGILKGLLDD